jgi:hypothetical protein
MPSDDEWPRDIVEGSASTRGMPYANDPDRAAAHLVIDKIRERMYGKPPQTPVRNSPPDLRLATEQLPNLFHTRDESLSRRRILCSQIDEDRIDLPRRRPCQVDTHQR